MNRLTPAPGADALKLRVFLEELHDKLVFHTRYGMSDWRLVDSAGAELLLALVAWETAPNPDIRWPWVLGAEMELLHAVREAAFDCPAEQGEEWR